ncbi:MAG: HAD family hydrolase [Candidatus Latescibacteria bacterium]|nr:HAD family hydrolase [Candidatus Latescibacterota bacterium]
MIKAIIFDMDGTITRPYIDWKALRERIGAVPGRTIIEYIEGLSPAEAERANRILIETEMEACVHSELNEGGREMLAFLRERNIRTALVTNNHREGMQVVLERHGLCFDVALSRDHGVLKPSADLLHKALEALSLRPDEVLSIGDGHYDLEASAQAGVSFLYVTHGRPALDHQPAVASMVEALSWVKKQMQNAKCKIQNAK